MNPRRACLAALLAGALAACAGPWDGPREITVSRQRLQEAIARAFPVQRSLAGLAELSLQAPTLTLLPQTNRLGLALDWVLAESLDGQRLTGRMALDFALRYDAEQGRVIYEPVSIESREITPRIIREEHYGGLH